MAEPGDPPGFLFAPSPALAKAPPGVAPAPAAEVQDGVVDDEASRAAAAIASGAPVDPTHGKPVGAGNALAFHQWLTKVPADGKLSISLIGTPSTHVGSTDDARQKNFDTYAKTNNYNVEITYPDGSREVKKFDVDGNSPPKYGNSNPAPKGKPASLSPEVEIDLKKWAGKGDITIRGWADGSSPGGYIEHRATILHV